MASTITRRGAARSRRDARVGEVEQEGAEDEREAGGQPDRAVEVAEDAAQQTRGGALQRDPSPEPLAAALDDQASRSECVRTRSAIGLQCSARRYRYGTRC